MGLLYKLSLELVKCKKRLENRENCHAALIFCYCQISTFWEISDFLRLYLVILITNKSEHSNLMKTSISDLLTNYAFRAHRISSISIVNMFFSL